MTEAANAADFNEYLEQEGISKDDIINQEIEEEHAQKAKIEVLEASKAAQDVVNKKLNNPNFFPMEIKLSINALGFVDMTEFNSKTYSPLEIDKKRKEYVQEKFTNEVYALAKNIKELVENDGKVIFSVSTVSDPFNNKDLAMKCLLAQTLKDLNSV